MRKIYVLDENNELKEIDAGITQYSELTDAPITLEALDHKVSIDGTNIVLTKAPGHKWTEEEVKIFCGIITDTNSENYGMFDLNINVTDGRYDILTEEQGREILIIDTIEVSGITTRRCRRITSQFD